MTITLVGPGNGENNGPPVTFAQTSGEDSPVFLSGQPGADTFVFGPNDNAPVTIADFTPHTAENAGQADAIDLSEFNFVSFEHDIAPLLHASESGADTVFNLPTGATVTLQNVLVASLHASDFIVQSHI